MAKIKILHLIKSLGRGGAEMLLPETLKLHDKERFEFFYIYFLPWKDQVVAPIEESGGEVTCISASNNFQILQRYSQVISYCKDNEIELIHCHLPWSGFLGRLVHRKTGIPVIYTEHNIQERYHFITKWLNKISFNSQSMALGVSEDVTRSIVENIAPNIPVKTILNGVDTNKFQKSRGKGDEIRKKFDIPLDAIVIGKIAVFREQKKLSHWVKAFKKISEKRPGVYGILVGAGPQEEEVKNLVKELGLTDKLKLAGLQFDTVAYFSAMDIFMMSSAFEGLPIALLEAMSMECAVVSTKAGGVVEAVRDNKDGFLCDIGDYEALAQKAGEMADDKDVRQDFQVRARKRVVESFSLATMVRSLETIYQMELDKKIKQKQHHELKV